MSRLDEALTLPVGPGTPAGVMRGVALELMAHGYGEAATQVLDRAVQWYDARPREWRDDLSAFRDGDQCYVNQLRRKVSWVAENHERA